MLSVSTLLTPGYWRQLLPRLHIDDLPFLSRAGRLEIEASNARDLEGLLVSEGYFQLDPPEWGVSIGDLADAVLELGKHNWMPPFVFLYDETWMLFEKLGNVLGHLL